MDLSKRKEELERELASINQKINSCKHEYGETKYDPEIVKVPYGENMEKQGSDVWFTPEGYRDEKRDRWSQSCKKCGHKRYSTKTVPTSFTPVF